MESNLNQPRIDVPQIVSVSSPSIQTKEIDWKKVEEDANNTAMMYHKIWEDTLASNKPSGDVINHPNHYTSGDIECIDAIRASMSPDEFRAYCKGNVIKYLWRYEHKNGLEDLQKARVYLNWMVESFAPKENTNGK